MSLLRKYLLKDDGVFPNSELPVLFYPGILSLPPLFGAHVIGKLFQKNGWSNTWKSGIYTFHHYHSNTHEVMGVCRGETTLQLGGERGMRLTIKRGDVLIIPAGVAHKNLGAESDVTCVGAYPNGCSLTCGMEKRRTGLLPILPLKMFRSPSKIRFWVRNRAV